MSLVPPMVAGLYAPPHFRKSQAVTHNRTLQPWFKLVRYGMIQHKLYCNVAPVFNRKIGHFWHLNPVERESHSSLYNTIQNTMDKVWLACVQRYLLNLP